MPRSFTQQAPGFVCSRQKEYKYKNIFWVEIHTRNEKSRNGDTLGPVELIVWPEQGNQGDLREQDDQGEVSSYLE